MQEGVRKKEREGEFKIEREREEESGKREKIVLMSMRSFIQLHRNGRDLKIIIILSKNTG